MHNGLQWAEPGKNSGCGIHPTDAFIHPHKTKDRFFPCIDKSRKQVNVWLDTAWEWSKIKKAKKKDIVHPLSSLLTVQRLKPQMCLHRKDPTLQV